MNRQARESFTAFVDARSATLIRTAYVLVGDQHSAEDLLQTALAKTAIKWRTIPRRTSTGMYHEQVSKWRKYGRGHPAEAVPEFAHPAPTWTLRLALEKAVLALPPRRRAVLVLRSFEDLPESGARGPLTRSWCPG